MKKAIYIFLFLLLIVIGYVFLKKAPIDSASYNPPIPKDFSLELPPNNLLEKSELIAKGKVTGPESIALDEDGVIYTGTQDGYIKKVYQDGKVETFVFTAGRPLGMKFDADGNLIVCDAFIGLLSVSPDGKIQELTQAADGVAFRFTDDLDISQEGVIYFTDASYKYYQPQYLYDLLESRPHGRLMQYDPKTKETTVLLKDLYFANGVALSEKEDFLLINETYHYQIRRYWLKGEKKGTSDIFWDNVPGFPDNITSNRKGVFYLALFTVRNPLMDAIHPYPFLKNLVSKLPKMFWPKPKPYGLVISFDERGKILQSLQDPSGKHLKEITSAIEHNGYLYLGSLHGNRIGKYKL
ncbi:MAG: SMP-30/gluconolactonase/LRE family protein [Leptospiraceae bacterium]|nr:SMP-30/gluconolactonase/LRE family protein [Leptospiraceae bacterium]MCP5493205.1 SMP-30/gluconolactonase/LRE family protein [Leptospiraceae bacterium]